MEKINWMEEVLKRKEDLIKDLQGILKIKSVLDEENSTPNAPLGQGVKDALQYLLDLGEKDGFTTKNVGDLAGHLEMGDGKDLLGILCHVDVVPEGDGWSVDPYGGEVKDGKIYSRGASDDKGPTMAAYYAMKIVKELGLPIEKRVRMIIGTDEESNWRCVEHYFKHEEMPSIGFAPDADFPIINAEKGIADYDIVLPFSVIEEQADITLLSFQSGRRYNMVPDFASAVLTFDGEKTDILQRYSDFLQKIGLKGKYFIDNGELHLELEGVSAHGMEPKNGKNAGLLLTTFLNELDLDTSAKRYIDFAVNILFDQSRGEGLGVQYQDEITGDLTINVGKMVYEVNSGGRFGLNMRYPVTFDMEKNKKIINDKVNEKGFVIENFSDSKPHHVDANTDLVKTLQKVYEEQTGEKAELLSIGGGTYARSLKSGVAFGALFPGRPDVMHQKDEFMFIEDLIKATAIYAQAIFELAKK
ncbi:dipeptidase PepV [Heyndrickxia oleronia]|uniref:Dipeptidase PepV n=1 Tax=Heyndrickxia oleronia TaxID=38875 RepID=A0A8E2I400_9BACI|nr:dipeptidase PepV [Heyndrickxia oleronia]NYV64269.1 dipeptidase PepV [Bacillus sp. Gen3]MBU5212625.1 dipeptidase PepV [Heyndrickxia oleronia]MCM3456030.1 dipeptidase PepV [Heyndrickxia oleronia]MEC1374102.1 dipeptidase PepV [Heyndrickxia oleronia]OOP66314.1 dipeptidase PepV [Heyndrickxia oleronia]